MSCCKDCQFFNSSNKLAGLMDGLSICKKHYPCRADRQVCCDFVPIAFIEYNHLNYLYIALLKNTELGLVEVPKEDSGYKRIEMTPIDWVLIDEAHMSNATKVTYPIAKIAWGLVTAFGIFDKPEKGKLVAIGSLMNGVPIFQDSQMQFNTGCLVVEITNLVETDNGEHKKRP